MSPLTAVIVVTLLVAAIAFALARFSDHRATRPWEPWWQSSAVWAGVAAVVVLLGVFVVPQILGFTFIFLPLFWVGGFGRRGPREPRPTDQER